LLDSLLQEINFVFNILVTAEVHKQSGSADADLTKL